MPQSRRRRKGFALGEKAKEAYRYREKLPAGGVAAPAHTYGIPKPAVPGDVSALIESLEDLTRITPALSKQYIRSKEKAGEKTFLRGEEKPEHVVSAQTYERLNGLSFKGAMQNIALNKSNQLLSDNPEIKYSQYEREMKKAIANPLQDKSGYFLEGLSETLIGLQSGIPVQWQKHDTERRQVIGFNSLSQISLNNTDDVYGSDDIRIAEGLEPLSIEEKVKQVRRGMNDLYTLRDVYDIAQRAQLTKRLVKNAGEKYSREGAPEKLGWMFLPDDHGIIPANTVAGQDAYDYLASAIKTKEQKIKNIETKLEDERLEKGLNLSRMIISTAHKVKPDDAGAFTVIENAINAGKDYLAPSEMRALHTMVTKLQDPAGFSRYGFDKDIYGDLMSEARTGTLKIDRLNDSAYKLTQPRYLEIFGEYSKFLARTSKDQKTRESSKETKVEKHLKSLTKGILSMAGGTFDRIDKLILDFEGNPLKASFQRKLRAQLVLASWDASEFTGKDGKTDLKAVEKMQIEVLKDLQTVDTRFIPYVNKVLKHMKGIDPEEEVSGSWEDKPKKEKASINDRMNAFKDKHAQRKSKK